MPPAVVIVMGVSSSGKTTVGKLLAARLGWTFEDGDRFHSAANVEKMKSGVALTDEDRWPWLRAMAAWIDDIRRAGGRGVLACSTLKRGYRDILIGARPDVRLVYLEGSEALVARRMVERRGHFMPSALLHSQFEALEPPGPDEHPVTVPIDLTPEAIVERIVPALA